MLRPMVASQLPWKFPITWWRRRRCRRQEAAARLLIKGIRRIPPSSPLEDGFPPALLSEVMAQAGDEEALSWASAARHTPSLSTTLNQSLVDAAQAGRFPLVSALASLGAFDAGVLTGALSVLLSEAHARGSSTEEGETQRWGAVQHLVKAGSSVPSAVARIFGSVRRLPAARVTELFQWGLNGRDPLVAWKLWAAWLEDPCLNAHTEPDTPLGGRKWSAVHAYDAVRALVVSGLSPHSTDERGRGPLHALCAGARMRGNPQSPRAAAFSQWFFLLHSLGADLGHRDNEGNTVLHASCDAVSAPWIDLACLEAILEAHPGHILATNRFGQRATDVLRAAYRQHRQPDHEAAWEQRIRWMETQEQFGRLQTAAPASHLAKPFHRRL